MIGRRERSALEGEKNLRQVWRSMGRVTRAAPFPLLGIVGATMPPIRHLGACSHRIADAR